MTLNQIYLINILSIVFVHHPFKTFPIVGTRIFVNIIYNANVKNAIIIIKPIVRPGGMCIRLRT